jgi:hypothetical protein
MTKLIAACALIVGVQAEPPLTLILQRVSEYALDFERRFSLLVAEEHYEQRAVAATPGFGGGNLSRANPGGGMGRGGREERRQLRSDYLLVRIDGGGGWMPFRDVYEVDGRVVRDRADRVLTLFLKPSPASLEQASRIMAESTRHNLGSVARTINLPTLAVLLVQPDMIARLRFDRRGDELLDGRAVSVLEFREAARPTLIRTNNDKDLPLAGKLWVDPQSGTILKTSLVAAGAGVRASVTVGYGKDPGVDFLVPLRMDEAYSSQAADTITCTATYSRYRRFNVSTDEQIKKPPPGSR